MTGAITTQQSAQLALAAEVEPLVGWLEKRDPSQRALAEAAATVRSCLDEETRIAARLQTALKQLQTSVVRVGGGPLKKLLKSRIASRCRLRNMAVAWTSRPEEETIARMFG